MPRLTAASWLSIAILSAPLTACATAPSSGCPPLVTYPREFQAKAMAEYERLPLGSSLKILITDYGKMRDACRATGGK